MNGAQPQAVLGKIVLAPIFEQNSYSIFCYYKLCFTFEHILRLKLILISVARIAGGRSRLIALSDGDCYQVFEPCVSYNSSS